jgi:integrase
LKFITTTDIEKVIDVFKNYSIIKPQYHFYFVGCLLQLRTGLRIGETYALNWQDIDWQNGYLLVQKTVQWQRTNKRPSQIGDVPKNCKNRTVILLPEVLDALKSLQKSQSRITGLIFSSDGIAIPSYSSIQHRYERVMKKAGVDFKSTHIMRHSFATHFLEATKDQEALQGLLGHSSSKMTSKYAKITDKTKFEGMALFQKAIQKTST